MAVVLAARPHHHRCGPALAEHSCAASTWSTPSGSSNKPWAGPDPASAHPRQARPLDLAHRRRPHPTPTGPPPHRRPAPTLGETSHRAPAGSPPPAVRRGFRNLRPTASPPSQRTKTLTTRPRTPTRLQEPPARPPTRRRQERHHAAPTKPRQVKNQAQSLLANDVAGFARGDGR